MAKKPSAKSKKTAAKSLKNIKKTRSNLPRDKNGRYLPGPGRPKGSKNKTPQQLLDLFLKTAFELEAEKGKSLIDCAKQDRKWFYALVVKMMPKTATVQADIEGEITIRWEK